MLEKPDTVSAIERKLERFLPPSLQVLISQLADGDAFGAFLALVRQMVPEEETHIMSQPTPLAQVWEFCQRFETRYFPLDAERWHPEVGDSEQPYHEILYSLPIYIKGMTYDEYDSISSGDWRNGILLMTYLVECPTADNDRVAQAEACAKIVPQRLVQRVPEEGYTREHLHGVLDDTKFEGLALWADYTQNSTDNPFLDFTPEFFRYGHPDVQWHEVDLEELTISWRESELMEQKWYEVAEWLEVDPAKHFKELLHFIEKGGEHGAEKEGGAEESVQLRFQWPGESPDSPV